MNKILNERCSNIELFRIVTMLLIVAHHYVVNSGLLFELKPQLDDNTGIWLFGAWGKTGINCFIMITGYYMCKSDISIRKFSKLYGEVLFYNILIYFFLVFIGKDVFSIKTLLAKFFPIKGIISDDFVGCYLVFFLLIPFLNTLIANIDQRKHLLLIVILLGIYTLLPLSAFGLGFPVAMNYISWFSVLFFVASYVRKYPIIKKESSVFWGVCTAISMSIAIASILYSLYISSWRPYKFVSDSNQICAFLVGFTSFMYFKNLSVGYVKIINYVASSTFAVLLIHINCPKMIEWIWYDMFNVLHCFERGFSWMHALSCVAIVFSFGIIIDKIRILLFENYITQLCTVVFTAMCGKIQKYVKY